MLPRFDSINLLFFIYFFFCCVEGRKLNQRESEKSRRLHSSNFKFVMKTNKKKTSDQAVKHGETNGARERVTKTEKQEELNTTLIIPLRLLCVVYFFFCRPVFIICLVLLFVCLVPSPFPRRRSLTHINIRSYENEDEMNNNS